MPAEAMLRVPASDARRRDLRVAILWAAAAAIALAAGLAPRYAQPEEYHRFADQRALFGIPNFLDVASNLAFVAVGVWGLFFVVRGTRADGRPAFEDPVERWGWGVVFAGTAATCLGSGYYHLAPDSSRLAWDRLPMAVAFMGMLAALVSERVSATAGRRLLVPLVLLGPAGVWYWRWSAARGAEDLNPYGAVQFGSLLLLLLLVALFPSRYTRGRDLLGGLATGSRRPPSTSIARSSPPPESGSAATRSSTCWPRRPSCGSCACSSCGGRSARRRPGT